MFYSASIQRLSGVLLHELSRSASSLFIIATLSFWVVKYWFCLSLCRNHGHKYYTVFVLQGRVRAFWEVVAEILKRAPCPSSNFYCPHSGVSHNSANKIPCQGTHIYLSYVCTHTFAFFCCSTDVFKCFTLQTFCNCDAYIFRHIWWSLKNH